MSITLRSDARMAGRVQRYHTWPHIREQTVADHSWQVVRILLSIWPEAPRHLLVHGVMHDMGEIRTGDAPYPIKADNPVLQQEMDRLEDEAVVDIVNNWGLPTLSDLSDDERWAFKLAEFIEMWEWGCEESLMGNQFAQRVASRCLQVVEERCHAVTPDEIPLDWPLDAHVTLRQSIAARAERYIRKRSEAWPTTLEQTLY